MNIIALSAELQDIARRVVVVDDESEQLLLRNRALEVIRQTEEELAIAQTAFDEVRAAFQSIRDGVLALFPAKELH